MSKGAIQKRYGAEFLGYNAQNLPGRANEEFGERKNNEGFYPS